MKYQQLIIKSKADFELNPSIIDGVISPKMFEVGAKWMFDKLDKNTAGFNKSINFSAYGIFKYGIAFFAFLCSVFVFATVNIFLIPFSIFLFYLVEVHFLFLFPLLIDNIKNPISTSIKLTYRIGLLNSITTVIPIGFYMIIGLFNFKKPFKNWYIGCLAIIIWYKDEIRNRL